MTRNAIIAAAGLAAIALPGFAHAQVNQHGCSVPFELAKTAAREALRACTANGYAVTVTLVDVSGIPDFKMS
jgi:phosphoribosylcarboxyaminoimidazole (NCAIR) mutase